MLRAIFTGLARGVGYGLLFGLIYTVGFLCVVLGPVHLAREAGLDDGVGLLVSLAVIVGGFTIFVRRHRKAEKAKLDRCLKPVLDAIDQGPVMDGDEKKYQADLVRHLGDALQVFARREQPLPTGTKVDAFMMFQEANWYITIKRNFENQDRLTIQGEIEDIMHEAARDRDLGILVIVGVTVDLSDPVWARLLHLQSYLNRLTCRRSREHNQRELFIEVVPVPIMSS